MSTLAIDDPPAAPGSPLDDVCLAARVSTADWRLRLFCAGLSPERRAAVANRPRFWSMPQLHRTGTPTDPDDELPL